MSVGNARWWIRWMSCQSNGLSLTNNKQLLQYGGWGIGRDAFCTPVPGQNL